MEQIYYPRIIGDHDGPALIMCSFACAQCSRISIAWVVEEAPYWPMSGQDAAELLVARNKELEWLPKAGSSRAYGDVPDHIAAAASESNECLSIGAYRASVLLARSVVEAAAKEKGITSGSLMNKINELAAQQLVRPIVQEAAHEIRHLGNDMAHGDFVYPVAREEAEETVGLMSEVLQEVFQAPAAIERFRLARLARQAARTAP